MSEFLPVEVYSNWCYWDQLDGKNIENNEQLEIAWPDGAIETVRVKVTEDESCCGHPGDSVGIRKAFAIVYVHGVPGLFRMTECGIKARRINN